jgi:Arc/MetJ-type ribon-helix-helix transcriptional regulator
MEKKGQQAQIGIDGELLAQIEACLEEGGFASAEAFVRHCVEKELKARREQAEKALAERLRALGYLE